MSPDLAKGLADCVGVLHGHDAGRPGSISVICDLIANPPGAPPPSWEIITKACKKVDARRTPMEPLTAPQLAVAALPLQYVAAGGRSGISEAMAARGRARGGVPNTGNSAKGVPRTGNKAKGVPTTGNAAKGVPKTGNAAKGVPKGSTKAKGVPKKGNAAKGVPKNGDAAKGVPKKGKKARGMCHTGETREEMLRRIRELKYGGI